MEKQPAEYTDKQIIQEVKLSSREIVKEKYPEEEEYFDFLFELIIPELQEMEPGKEAEFLREIRGAHPLALGCTAVITVVFQVLAKRTYREMDMDDIEDIIKEDVQRILDDLLENNKQEEFSDVPRILIKNIQKARIKAKKEKEEKEEEEKEEKEEEEKEEKEKEEEDSSK